MLAVASPTSRTWAHANGQITVDTYAAPARAKQDDGSWKWIDPSLTERDGTLTPVVPSPKLKVEFSTGGKDKPFAAVDVAGKGKLALDWPTALPRPAVSGNSAVYANAAGSGADLVVTAFASGFRFNVKLRQRPSGPLEFRMPVQSHGLALGTDSDGALVLKDSKGKELGVGNKPRMWDRDTARRTAQAREADVRTAVEGKGDDAAVVLKPSMSFLNDPSTRFPVTVDPDVTLGLQDDTWIENSATYGQSQHSDIQLWAGGYQDPFEDTYRIDRTFLKFDATGLAGRTVYSASLRLRQHFLTGCGDVQSGLKAQRVTSSWDPLILEWNAQPATTQEGEAVTRDAAGCTEGQDMTWSIPSIAQAWANGAPNYGVLLRGVDESATRPDYSRVFDSAEWGGAGTPKLSVTYWLAPEAPTISLGKVDVLRGNDAVVRDSTVGLTYTSSSAGGEDLEYSMAVDEYVNPVSLPAPHVGGSGQQVTRDVALGNANSVKLAVKACLSGVTPPVCNTTPAYRITSDAPDSPATVGTDLSDPGNPVLMGLIARPSGKQVTGRFFLYDSTGAPAGPSPIGEGTVADAYQIALRLPDGVVQAGQTYTWKLQACASETCTPQSAGRSFTVPTQSSPPPMGTHRLTIEKDALTIRTAKSAADACAGQACPLEPSSTIVVGGDAADRRITWLSADVGALPGGAQITSAVLNLGTPACDAAPCVNDRKISATATAEDVTDATTGAGLAELVDGQPPVQATVGQPVIDVTEIAKVWDQQPGAGQGIALQAEPGSPVATFGASGVSAPVQLVIDYLPAAAPAAVGAVSTRGGDGGVHLSWAAPADEGSSAGISRYDIQVINGSSAVVHSLSTKETHAVVTGLSNGTAYRAQVRAVNATAAGSWTTSAAFTPSPVPGGGQQYIEAVRQYQQARNELAQGDSTTVDQALTGKTRATLIRASLHAEGADLIDWAAQSAEQRFDRTSVAQTLDDVLVSHSADTGQVTVHAEVKETVRTTIEAGTTNEEISEDPSLLARAFVFNAATDRIGLVRSQAAGADQPDGRAGELNALPAGTPVPPLPDDAAPLPVDQNGYPVETARTRQSVATAAVNRQAIATWAVNNAHTEPYDFDNDCANFASKALYRGGGVKMAVPPSALGALSQRKDPRWWYQSWPRRFLSSYSWSAAHNFYLHFIKTRGRASWVRSWADVGVGDLLLIDWHGNNVFGHVSVVSKKSSKSWKGVYYAQHQPTYQWRSLVDGMTAGKKKYPNMKVYAIRVNW
ncbi:DNRLRE domain-containing protein [Nonomuraea sp. NBC_00507]|uniref:DNRLRE domain-containing protein n=1 Tax=Nonomuraea sp. NBC_00507 TaxID=2976002 RepID=UPI002E19966E